MSTNAWDERYAAHKRLWSERPDECLVELASDLPPGRALDLGAGEGRNSLWLARKGWKVTAVDISQVALQRLSEQARREHLIVATEVGDINEFLERGERFDLLVLAYVHPGPEERANLFERASRALTPGGHLYVIGHDLSALGQAGPPQPERLFTAEMLKAAFPELKLLCAEKRESRHGDRDVPVMDVVAWAFRPAAVS